MKILLIEDEPELQKSIKQYFEMEGNVVELASNYTKTQQKIALYDYDCILVDITLPGGGISFASQIEKRTM